MTPSAVDSRLPLQQQWPEALVARYRAAGHWRGETFPGFLRERAAQFADHVAVVGGETRLTYAQLWQEAGRIGAGFLAAGLAPGDRVVVQLGNTVEFVSVVCGLFRAGLIPVYALPAHRLTEIAHVVRTAEASAYIAAASSPGTFDYRTLARELQAFIPALRHVFIVGDAAEFVAVAGLAGDPDALPPDPDPQSVAFLQLSGGSTGLPKLIPRTHDDYLYSFRASNGICGIGRDSVYLVALPAAHNFPMSSPGFFGALYAGARVVLSPGPGPDTAFPLIARERVTCVGLVPPLALLWAQAAASTAHDLSSLQVLQVVGAKLVPEAARRVIEGLGCQRAAVEVLGYVATQAFPGRRGLADHGQVVEVGDAGAVTFQALAFAQVGILVHAVEQPHGLATAAALGHFVEHAEERRQARAAGHQQQRSFDLAQVEAAQGQFQFQALADLAAFAQEVAHHPVGQQANEELQVVLPVALVVYP